MKRLLVSTLALGLALAAGLASAQSYRPAPPYLENDPYVRHDYARVVRVEPVPGAPYDSRYAGAGGPRCQQRQTQIRGDGSYVYGDGYRDGYPDDGYRDNDYRDPYGGPRQTGGTRAGATAATVVGGIVGAVIGSQVGGGSARYATSALGSMVGGMAGREIYEQGQRERQPDRVGTVTVCEPEPRYGDRYYGSERAPREYDVTYEYAGHQYTTRMDHDPGDRVRVRVDVRAE